MSEQLDWMSEQLDWAPGLADYPSVGVIGETGQGSHVDSNAAVDSPGALLTAKLAPVSAGAEPQILITGHLTTPEEARAFARAILRLADQATRAPGGLDLITTLARGRVTLAEMALASGLDVERLKDQHAGGQVLSVHDIDQLALAVAHLTMVREDQTGGTGLSLGVA
jgi:hypothetical protein